MTNSLAPGDGDRRGRCLSIAESAVGLAGDLVGRSDAELRSSSQALMAHARGMGLNQDALIAEALAVYLESTRRVINVSYSLDEVFAAAAMCVGLAPELSGAANGPAGMAAYWFSLQGRGVHVMLADDYLARRDVLSLAVVLRGLGRRVALLSEGMSDDERRRANLADITVGSYLRFMDDFLYDKRPVSGSDPIQRHRSVAVVGDGSSLALGRAAIRGALLAPRATLRRLARLPESADMERAAARVLRDDGIDVDESVVRFNSRGIRALAEELRLPEFLPEFVLAAEEIRSQRQSSLTGSELERVPFLEIAFFAYLRQYETLACAVWSASEDGPELAHLYGVPCVQLHPANDGVASPGFALAFAGPSQRLDALRRKVHAASSAGASVMVRTTGVADAEACADLLASDGIRSVLVRPGNERDAFAQVKAGGAVTIVEPGVTMPESLDLRTVTELAAARLAWAGISGPDVDPQDVADAYQSHRHDLLDAVTTSAASSAVYLALGADSSPSFIDWQRIASVDGAESWTLTCPDDPLLAELDSEVAARLRELPDSFDIADPDRHSALSASVYRAGLRVVRLDRLAEWALRSSVEKQADLFYQLRDFLVAAPVDEIVARLIEEYAAEVASVGEPKALQRGVSAIVDGVTVPLPETSDAEYRRRLAQNHLTNAYETIRAESDPAFLSAFTRQVALASAGNSWFRFLNIASFIRLHLDLAYGVSPRTWAPEYERDMSIRFSRSMQEFRQDTLRTILNPRERHDA